MSDYTQSPDQILIDLVNSDNNLSLAVGQVTFGTPAVRVDGTEAQDFNNRKTTIRATAVVGSGYSSFVDLQYNRIHFRDVFHITDDDPTVQLPIANDQYQLASNVYIADLLPEINSAFALNLQPADFWDQPLPTFTGPPPYAPAYVTLQAHPESEIFIGGVKLRILPNDYPMAEAAPNTQLNGLNYDNSGGTIPPSYARLNTFLNSTMAATGYW